MKTLPFDRKPNGKVFVQCGDKAVAVHTTCIFCAHCMGIRVNRRVSPNPYAQAFRNSKGGFGMDEEMMNAMIQFNTIIEDKNATDLECDDDGSCGFLQISRRR